MTTLFEQRLNALSSDQQYRCLSQILHGIEKEGLRVTGDLHLARTQHPEQLGSALTHPCITTDFSEALLEFVTPTFTTPEEALAFLSELHAITLQQLPDHEMIWNSSMPAVLQGEQSIPLAWYGNSNSGYMKHVYRQGLANRYGKAMQTIAGIHYNFSLPDDFWTFLQGSNHHPHLPIQSIRSEGYFALIRNFHRYAWLLSYLFGASPAVDKSFFIDRLTPDLEWLDQDTLYLPWATSLRMSDLGYTSSAQSSLSVQYDSLDNYIQTIRRATQTPYPPYQDIGVYNGSEYQQLNSNLLQIENEFYSAIRPKRVTKPGEKPTEALEDRGVQYIEVRNLDINPLMPVGIDTQQARIMDIFLLFCALHDSPAMSEAEQVRNRHNFALSVQEGRRPGLTLQDGDQERTLTDWGHQLFAQMLPVAQLLDRASSTDQFSASLKAEQEKLDNVETTPSAIILARLQQGQSFREFTSNQSRQQAESFRQQALPIATRQHYQNLARQSLAQQQKMEDAESMDFATYLQNYFGGSQMTTAA